MSSLSYYKEFIELVREDYIDLEFMQRNQNRHTKSSQCCHLVGKA